MTVTTAADSLFRPTGTGAVPISVQKKLLQFRTFEDFGAVGDYVTSTDTGTDDTNAIQAAIDWAYAGGIDAPRAILMTAKQFLCGNITVYPTTTIIGTGRQTSLFFCKNLTAGKWWSDNGNGAQKIMFSGIAWYGRGVTGLTHGVELGSAVQYGTEGILQGLWIRDIPNGYGLHVNGNVGIFKTISVQSCQNCIKVLGNGNLMSEIVSVAATSTNVDLTGTIENHIEVEATEDGGLPLKLSGDCHVRGLIVATADKITHSHLIEINDANYLDWSLEAVTLLGTTSGTEAYHVTNGILKVGANFRGGTDPNAFTGASYKRHLELHSGNLSLKYQRWQAFGFKIINDGGTLKHAIGSQSDTAAPATFDTQINGASTVLTATPTGSDSSTAFAAGAKLSGSSASVVILDTPAQTLADQGVLAPILFNSSTVALTCWPQFVSYNVNGVTRSRLILQFFNATSGAPYSLTSLSSGQGIVVGLSGFLA